MHKRPRLLVTAAVIILPIAAVLIVVYGMSTGPAGTTGTDAPDSDKTANHASYEEPAVKSNVKVIEIEDGKFEPQTIRTKVNDIIAFKNEDRSARSVILDSVPPDGKPFNTGPLKPGDRPLNVVEYDKAGTYTFRLESDPQVTGTIIVE